MPEEELDEQGAEPRPPGVAPEPDSAPRVLAGTLLLLSLLLAAAGQLMLSTSRGLGLGIAAFVGGFVSLLLFVRALQRRATTQLETWLARLARRSVSNVAMPALLAGAAVFAVLATAFSQSSDVSRRGWPSFGLWLGGVLAIAAFAVVSAKRAPGVAAGQRFSPGEIAGVAAVTLLAFLVRVVDLEDVPYPASGDETAVGLEGLRILDGQSRDMFRTGWSAQPFLSFLGPALSISVFGRTLAGLRLYPALVGTLTVPALHFVVRAMYTRAVAFLAALLLAGMALHVNMSRIAVNNVGATLIVCVVVGLLYAVGAHRRLHWFVLAGLATGFGMYSFAGARLTFVLALLYLGFLLATDPEVRRRWPRLLLFAAAAAVVVLPTAVFFLEDPNVGLGRLNTMGIVQSGWLARESARTGTPEALIVGSHFADSFGIFVARPTLSLFFRSAKPILDPVWSVALILGLMFSWIQISDRRSVILNLWFWSVLFFGGALILPPPHAERLLPAAPAVAAFTAFGLWNVWSAIAKLAERRRLAVLGASATAAILAAGSLIFYFREYTARYYFADPGAEIGTELGRYLARDPRVKYVYFTGLPRMWYRSQPTIEFLSGGAPGEDFATATVPDIRGKGRPLLFVALPHLRTNLDAIEQAYPGGERFVVWRRPRPQEPLYFAYRLD
jgi:Dolichyl-phosphate-mannose-protein mannosyltransferase